MEETKPKEISSTKMFDGYNKRYKHYSPTLGCSMTFFIYFPPTPKSSSAHSHKFPVLYWLSGLTCTDENFIIKSGAQRTAASEGIALIAPDTSPRGLNVDGEADSWDFGVGAGFYLNAKQEKWKNWRMYDYVTKELPSLLSENFVQLDTSRASIFGHSMGGHGALTVYLKNLDKYKSVSAFAPIVNPINCPWGQKAFTNYLGENKTDWEDYDATCLISKFKDVSGTILIDQGQDDGRAPPNLNVQIAALLLFFNQLTLFSSMAAATFSSLHHKISISSSPNKAHNSLPSPNLIKFPSQIIKHSSFISSVSHISKPAVSPLSTRPRAAADDGTAPATAFHGVCYVVGDNIDTDQIIPAEYLTLVPSNPEEYKKLGSFALIGLPVSKYPTRFMTGGEFTSQYSILIAGDNFGCGSSREHAPVALGAAGVKAVVAESYARIFFRNSVSTGEVYPLESEKRICEECKTGDVITIELGESLLINHTSGKEYKLKPVGDVGPVIEAGGIFAYARKAGMIPSRAV